jgi:hypothetical protein
MGRRHVREAVSCRGGSHAETMAAQHLERTVEIIAEWRERGGNPGPAWESWKLISCFDISR